MARKLLLIDDEVSLGQILQDMLSPYFDEVDYASEPRQALTLLEQKEYRLIISDIMMPDLRGPDLVRIVRAKGDLTPIIFLTGFADKNAALSALRLGVADVLEKPFDEDVLVQSINRVLEIEKRRAQLLIEKMKDHASPEQIERMAKMLGLLQVANEQKKHAA